MRLDGRLDWVGVSLMALGAGLAVAALAIRKPPPPLEPARAAAVAAAQAAAEVVAAEQRALRERAESAASLERLQVALSYPPHVPTLVDLFANEDWWAPFRQDMAVSRAVVGDTVATYGSPDLGDADRGAVAEARRLGSATRVLACNGQPLVVAATRVPGSGEVPPVLVLARPLDPRTLRGLAERAQIGIALAQDQVPLLTGGPRAFRAALHEVIAHREAEVRSPSGGWVAVRVALSGKLGLWAVGAWSNETSRSRPTQLLLLGAAGLLALAGLGTAAIGRKHRPERTAAASEEPAPGEGLAPIETLAPSQALSLAPAGGPFRQTACGRYRIIERVGVGGMSEVYTAVATGAQGFSRTFVIKLLRPELARDTEAVAHFIDEARVQASLVHSNIVPVFDFGATGNEYFMIEEYIPGRDLERLSNRCLERTGQHLDPQLVFYFISETLQALAYAHKRRGPDGEPMGIVHRDVSAGNILLSSAGEVKLFDFGIVKASGRAVRTQIGQVKGNVSFMSPEQARGQVVDARSDLYSLGLVMYTCLTNQSLYAGANHLEILYQAACGPGGPEREAIMRLPAPVPEILSKALAVDPADRFQTAEEFAAALAPHTHSLQAQAASLVEQLFGDEIRREATCTGLNGTAPAVRPTPAPAASNTATPSPRRTEWYPSPRESSGAAAVSAQK
jgi:serine/threonine protein kinase